MRAFSCVINLKIVAPAASRMPLSDVIPEMQESWETVVVTVIVIVLMMCSDRVLTIVAKTCVIFDGQNVFKAESAGKIRRRMRSWANG